jgi:hypothetical protein
MTRMNLSHLIQFLINNDEPEMAEYFSCFRRGEQVPGMVVDGLIDADLVKWYIDEVDETGLLLELIQSEVTSYIIAKK